MAPEMKKKLRRRMAIIKGQTAGLEKMIAEDKYCVDVITQSSAIRHALSWIEDAMLENHLSTHVIHQMRSGESKKATAEIVKLFAIAKKRA